MQDYLAKNIKQSLLVMTKKDLKEIEKTIISNLDPYLDIVSKISSHLLFAGGKRLRPLLMVLCSRLCAYNGDFDKKLSVVFEYIHTATLLHDDLIDDADLRRGKPVAHSLWGNSEVILTGDFLFAKASSIAVDSGNFKIVKLIADIIQKMSQGEIHQLLNKGSINTTEEEYFEIIGYKTAALIEGACRSGAFLAGASEQELKAISIYGNRLGIVFQLCDDMLDYTADANSIGKNIGADLKEGKLTLPVIYALENANAEDRSYMIEMIRDKEFSVEQFIKFKNLLIKYEGLEYTKALAEEYISEAVVALNVFDDSKTRKTLFMIADYFLERKE